ncbi:MAG: hypothetical protein QM758_16420 [Armatimonas sp.]
MQKLAVLFRAYLPLALSFELMMAEAPTLHAAVGRFPNPEANLAAWGLTIGLALLIESPVILLLTTTIALVRDRPSFLALRRFMLTLAIACTLLTALVAFTPLYGFITGTLMNQPEAVAQAARGPLSVLLFWTAAIAWRRFYQGVLVRFGQTKWMTWGTLFRLISIGGVAWFFAKDGDIRTWPSGALTAAFALMTGVLVEAIASTIFAARTVGELPPEGNPLSQKEILQFHTPLALNTLLSLLAQPLTAAALARLPHAETTLAAWPVTFGVLLVMRGWGLAVQELSVAQIKSGEPSETLQRFALIVGLVTAIATFAIALTLVLDAYLTALHTPAALWADIRQGILLAGALPLLTALGSFVRGRLVAQGKTTATLSGMALALGTQCLVLVGGVLLQLPGMTTAALAMTASQLAELGFLSLQSAQKITD